jgi:hypothetical protein
VQTYQDVKQAIADAAQGAKDAQQEANAAQGTTPASPSSNGRIVIGGRDGEPDVNISLANGAIRITQGTKVQTIPVRDMVPPDAVALTAIVCGSLAFVIVGWPIARALARLIDRRTLAARDHAVIDPQWAGRVAQLEQNIDTVAIEVEKLAEAQRFTAKLLAERPPLPRAE